MLEEFIESMPGIDENCCSSGVATEVAIVSGLAPGSAAETVMVGKSTLGKSLIGSVLYPKIPNRIMLAITSTVITGRCINGLLKFTC